MKLNTDLLSRILSHVEKNPYKWEWDYNQELSQDNVNKIIIKGQDGLIEVENELQEYNLDYSYIAKRDHLKYLLDDFKSELIEFIATDQNVRDYDHIGNNYNDYLETIITENNIDSHLIEDLNLEQLAGRSIACLLVQMHSNYDCINSFHFETSYEQITYKESYLGDVINLLKLNPTKVKKTFEKNNIKVSGRWPNYKHREGKELTTYEDFFDEFHNTTCGANLFCFAISIRMDEFITIGAHLDRLIIPKSTPIGFFSSMYGGGSCFDAVTTRDMVITPGKPISRDNYNTLSLCSANYMKDKVYGLSEDFYPKVTILKSQRQHINA